MLAIVTVLVLSFLTSLTYHSWWLPCSTCPMVVPGKVSRVEGEAKAMEAGRGVMWVNMKQPRLGMVNIQESYDL